MANYVEPLFGSGAVLLGRPNWTPDMKWIETVNDKDGYLANFWRAVQHDPEQTAHWADWPVNENDLTARHIWLVQRKAGFVERLEGDPDFYDAKVAGWWVWGISCWIGSGWCSGDGSWTSVDGKLVHLGASRGVKRQLVQLGRGRGVKRQLVHLGSGAEATLRTDMYAWFESLAARLARVRVCCGDWQRVCGPTPTVKSGTTGVFLDPPYSQEERADGLYSTDEDGIAGEVCRWAIEHGDDPRMRIALCGYDTEHAMPDTWEAVRWKAHGGYGSQGNGRGKDNRHRETIWFSPHCLRAVQGRLVED